MANPAAFQATYSDWRVIKGRKVVSISFEVPLEMADLAYQVIGGMPDPSISKWFAIARLEKKNMREPAKKSWEELPSAQQAGIRCSEEKFQEFIAARGYAPDDLGPEISGEDIAKAGIYNFCGIFSRAELSKDSTAAKRWHEMEKEYQEWLLE